MIHPKDCCPPNSATDFTPNNPANDMAVSGSRTVGATAARVVVPAPVADASEGAARRFLEFFAATIRNKNTRLAYYRAVVRFFTWCECHQLTELVAIEPLHVAAYIEELQRGCKKPLL
jgi:hypothetical protein